MKIQISGQTVFNVLILILLIINFYFIYNLNSRPTETSQQTQPQSNVQSNVQFKLDCGKSLDNYDAIFIYVPTCPHCQKMEPLVEKSSIKFYWINPQEVSCAGLNLTKFNFGGYIPHFYCIKTGDFYTGEMPEQDFNTWVNKCKS